MAESFGEIVAKIAPRREYGPEVIKTINDALPNIRKQIRESDPFDRAYKELRLGMRLRDGIY